MTTIPTNAPPKPVVNDLLVSPNDGIIRQERTKRSWATLLYSSGWRDEKRIHPTPPRYYLYNSNGHWVYRSPVVAPNMDLRKWEQALMRSLVEFEDFVAISFEAARLDIWVWGYCERQRNISMLLENQHKPYWHSVAALQEKYAADTLEGRIISDWLEKDQPTYRYATPIHIRGDA